MAFLNQPSGATIITDWGMSSPSPANGTYAALGNGWSTFSGRVSAVSDPTAPESPSAVARFNFDGIEATGVSPGSLYYEVGTGWSEVYFAFWWKPSTNFLQHPANLTKIAFLYNGGQSNYIPMLAGPPGGPFYLKLDYSSNVVLNGGQPSIFIGTTGDASITLGTWYLIELYAKRSTTQTSQDGIIRMWKTPAGGASVQLCNRTNMNNASANFSNFVLNCTWGGVSNNGETGVGDFYYDHVRVADATGTGGTGGGGGGTGGGTTGLLQGSRTTPASTINLSSEGVSDWVHWGLSTPTSVDRKSGGNLISAVTTVGGVAGQYSDNPTSFTWSGGTPNGTSSGTTTGIYVLGNGYGFQFTVPADTTQRTLKVYSGAYGGSISAIATLSDSSAASYTDSTFSSPVTPGGTNAVWTFVYKAGSANQSLTVFMRCDSSGGANVQLQAATLTTQGAVLPVPTITSFTPASGLELATVTIIGTNFDALASNNTVKFNGTTASVTSASTTSLMVVVPIGATTGPITVTTAGGTATSGSNFTVDSPPPPVIPPEASQGGSAMMILMMP